MKKITEVEFNEHTSGYNDLVIREILNLDVGQGLEVDYSEWNHRRPLPQVIWICKKRWKKKFKTRSDKEGKKYSILRLS